MKLTALLAFFLMVASTLFAQSPPKGFFLSPAEIQSLPRSGKSWDYLRQKAGESYANPDLSDQDDEVNVRVLAGALVYSATGDAVLREKVRTAVLASVNTENGGRTLALGRELGAYVVAADLCGFANATQEANYKAWLTAVRRETLDGKTLISTHEIRPNNWGTIAGWSRMAADLYLGDRADFDRAAKVFRGYLGDRAAYAGFDYGDLSWQCNRNAPVGINGVGCTISGHLMDGGLPEELRRGGGFTWPPPCENYVGTGLEGVYLQAWLLSRNGYPDVWTWSFSAIGRASVFWHNTASCRWTGNDIWMGFLNDYVYGTTLRYSAPAPLTRAVIGADWWGMIVGQTPPPDPDPQPFSVTFKFTFATGVWTAHIDGTADGLGATTNAALKNWCDKNPNEP